MLHCISSLQDYVRVTSMGTKEDFTATILASAGALKASGPDPDRPMGIKDYDLFFHAPVNKHLQLLEKIFEYAYEGVTVRESRDWPLEPYGKGDNFGQIHICCRSMGQYRANFENYIGIEALKAMKTRLEWFKEMRKVNNETANKAAELRSDEARIKEAVKLGEIEKKVQNRREIARAVMTEDGPRDARLPMTPYPRPTIARTAPFRSSAPELTRQPFNQSGDYRNRQPGHSFPRNARIEFEDDYNLLEETRDCDNPLLAPGLEEVRRQYAPFADEDEYDGEWRNFPDGTDVAPDAMFQPAFSPVPGGQKPLSDPRARDPNKPCYRHFEKKDCPGNCGWSHSQEAMHKLMLERLDSVLNSPYTPLELLKSEVAKLDSRSPNQHISALNAAMGTWGTTDNRQARSSPSPARILDSSQPFLLSPSGSFQGST